MRVAIIGGGPNGIITSNQLVDQYQAISSDSENLEITIYGRTRWGHGLVYGENELSSARQSFTNQKMGVDPQDKQALLKWIEDKKDSLTDFKTEDLKANSYPPRQLIGHYFEDNLNTLQDKVKQNTRIKLQLISESVSCLKSVKLDDSKTRYYVNNQEQAFDALFFCLGNFPSAYGRHLNAQGYHSEIWGKDVFSKVRSDQNILVIGSGLSSIDVLFGLNDYQHNGQVVFASRRGLLPKVRADLNSSVQLSSTFYKMLKQKTISLSDFENQLDSQSEINGGNKICYSLSNDSKVRINQLETVEQAVVRLVSEYIALIWPKMSALDKSEFDKKHNAVWNAYSLPMAKHSAKMLVKELTSKRLTVVVLKELNQVEDYNFQAIINQQGNQQTQTFEQVFNATGRNLDVQTIDDQLIRNLLKEKIFIADQNGGFQVDPKTAQSTTLSGRGCYMIGPLTRGSCFYTYLLSENAKQSFYAVKDFLAKN